MELEVRIGELIRISEEIIQEIKRTKGAQKVRFNLIEQDDKGLLF